MTDPAFAPARADRCPDITWQLYCCRTAAGWAWCRLRVRQSGTGERVFDLSPDELPARLRELAQHLGLEDHR